ncbi:hypothetical protein O0I10_011572 [Lichtheimia ornata]|uniref:Uncharacterized protein n=1 Tax=Lichtheimia ornata TaxID=688661 RepID=A0AAD7USR4_9FUNG|nr:uncharacterized protein O0I10_011572 [Lichtheimia ornata]KAJ8652767.1 hypothetical protein O0I10_011572 [Lichtheimia ornata]
MNPFNNAPAAAQPPVTFPVADAAPHPIGTSYDHKYQLLSLNNASSMYHTSSSLLATPRRTPPQEDTCKTDNHNTTTTTHKQQQQQQHQEKQRAYVNALVDVTVQAIASIWPNACSTPSNGNAQRPIANLNTFLHHILKHSRTTHSTLQLAIFYLFRIRPRVLEQRHDNVYIACGRRMFLAALICAHKFLQDKTYKNSAWSKVSGLSVAEVNHAERVMLQLLDWSLYVKKDTYDKWIMMLQGHLKYAPSKNHTTTTTTTHSSIDAAFPNDNNNNNNLQTPPLKIPALHAPITSRASLANQQAKTIINLGMPTPVQDNLCSPPHKRKADADDDDDVLLAHPSKRRVGVFVH